MVSDLHVGVVVGAALGSSYLRTMRGATVSVEELGKRIGATQARVVFMPRGDSLRGHGGKPVTGRTGTAVGRVAAPENLPVI